MGLVGEQGKLRRQHPRAPRALKLKISA